MKKILRYLSAGISYFILWCAAYYLIEGLSYSDERDMLAVVFFMYLPLAFLFRWLSIAGKSRKDKLINIIDNAVLMLIFVSIHFLVSYISLFSEVGFFIDSKFIISITFLIASIVTIIILDNNIIKKMRKFLLNKKEPKASFPELNSHQESQEPIMQTAPNKKLKKYIKYLWITLLVIIFLIMAYHLILNIMAHKLTADIIKEYILEQENANYDDYYNDDSSIDSTNYGESKNMMTSEEYEEFMERSLELKIMMAQLKLKADGYYDGKLDGIIGEKTKKALEEYQKDNGLPITGELDEATLKALNIK